MSYGINPGYIILHELGHTWGYDHANKDGKEYGEKVICIWQDGLSHEYPGIGLTLFIKVTVAALWAAVVDAFMLQSSSGGAGHRLLQSSNLMSFPQQALGKSTP